MLSTEDRLRRLREVAMKHLSALRAGDVGELSVGSGVMTFGGGEKTLHYVEIGGEGVPSARVFRTTLDDAMDATEAYVREWILKERKDAEAARRSSAATRS